MNKTVKQQLEFIAKWEFQYSEQYLNEVYHYHYQHALCKLTGINWVKAQDSLEDGYRPRFTRNFVAPIKHEPEQEAYRFTLTFLNNLGITIEEARQYDRLRNAFIEYYFIRGDKPHIFYAVGIGPTDLLRVILTIQGNILSQDGSELETAAKDRMLPRGQNKMIIGEVYEHEGVTIKTYANGRVDIKGLTDDQQKHLDRLIAVKELLKDRR